MVFFHFIDQVIYDIIVGFFHSINDVADVNYAYAWLAAIGKSALASKAGKKGGGIKIPDPGKASILATIGAIKMVAGKIKQRRADAMMPSAVDPEERAQQVSIRRQLRAVRTGTASQAERQSKREALREGYTNVFRSGGRRGLSRLFAQYQGGLTEIGAREGTRGDSLLGKLTAATGKITQRKLELGLAKYEREQARAAQTLKEGKATTNLALAKLLGGKGGGGIAGSKKTETEDTETEKTETEKTEIADTGIK